MADREAVYRFLFDRDLEPEVAPELLACMTPAEIAEADQLLAARFEIGAALSGDESSLTDREAGAKLIRLGHLLETAVARKNSAK